ncbi:MAG: MBOAT family protein [Gloeocapsa sp. DLM2.Bin57]|nr:MAG: MBOAT family protein [Gloeocapsa sp. DLM2.Bin57]
MNYSDFSFWWILLLFSLSFFSLRFLGKITNFWQPKFDSYGLLILSLTLFLSASQASFIVFIFEIVFNYLMVSLMLRRQGWSAKLIATIVIVFNVAVLAYFKYLTFLVEDVIGLFIGVSTNWQDNFILPVKTSIPPGVSFYTFQMIAFVVDSFKARKKKPINFLDYVNFIAFFPQLVAGPIERKIDLFPQLQSFQFKFTWSNCYDGLRWLSLGLFLKFVLGDNLALYIDPSLEGNPWLIWLQAFLFTLRIYFDFAGYSFIAVGIAKFLGIKLTINFLAPYTSQSINEFWRRWHITLSTWFRDYIFLPLMNLNKSWAAFFLFITFTLSGFWHGAAWNFIIWGAYHGSLLLILRYLGRPFQKWVNQYVSQSEFISWGLTFASVILGCLFFMDTNSRRLLAKLQTILTPWDYSWHNLTQVGDNYTINEGTVLVILLLLSIGVLFLEHLAIWQQKFEYELLLSPWISPLLLGLSILLASNSPADFIYFEF